MALTMDVGQKDGLAIKFLSRKGVEMPAPALDSPPAWTQTTPATETLAAAADGMTATLTALEVGSDQVGLTVVVGGVTFNATLDVMVEPPQLGSVEIVTGQPI